MTTLLLRRLAFLVVVAACGTSTRATTPAPATAPAAQAAPVARPRALPDRLSDREFWALVDSISEPGGFFRIVDNFTSNEAQIGMLAGMVRAIGPKGGVYMGVGPEQNFSYIAAVRPRMAFIVDIRRQAVMHHLMYKAIFELSKDRADFISLLFSLPRPPGITDDWRIGRIWSAFETVQPDRAAAQTNLARISDHLTKTHGFTFTADETEKLIKVYQAFVLHGPHITTNGPPGRGGSGFADLTSSPEAELTGFLATEESYRFIKELHEKNLFVPTSGNFGGPKAIRAIAAYLKDRNAHVSAFYVSNVEQYLFMDGIAGLFYGNVAALPMDSTSIFIRPSGTRTGVGMCPIAAFLASYAAGNVMNTSDATRCPR
jgi:hypothetical protein